MNSKTVGLIVGEEVTATDLMGAAEVFSRAKIRTSDQAGAREFCCYRPMTIGVNAGPCATECGVVIRPETEIEQAPTLDTLIVCSGGGRHGEQPNRKLTKWLKERTLNTRRIAALGRGIYALAASGLLDGRQAVIHWLFATAAPAQTDHLGHIGDDVGIEPPLLPS